MIVDNAVYRAGSVSRAAEQLDMTQPAASQGLTRLRTLAPSVPTVYLMDRTPVRFWNGSLPMYQKSVSAGSFVRPSTSVVPRP